MVYAGCNYTNSESAFRLQDRAWIESFMDNRDLKRLVKAIFAMLGQKPDAFGIVLDEGGWISTKELHQALMAEQGFPHITSKALRQFFPLYRPEKFEWQEDRVRVRPEWQSPGLTIYKRIVPPEPLYVTIRPRAHAHVIAHGLRPGGNKRWIVLSTDKEMALRIGRRRDRDPIVAEILVLKACKAGLVFRRAGDLLYLVQELDPQWMNIPPLPSIHEKDKHPRGPKSRNIKPSAEKTPPKGSATPLEQIGGFVLRRTSSHYRGPIDIDKERGRDKKIRGHSPKWKKDRHAKKRSAKNKRPHEFDEFAT